MDMFTRGDLRSLVQTSAPHCVSIYMPTHPTGREIREDSLRCKNLIEEAQEQLQESGVRSPVARGILEPAWRIQGDSEFWKRQSRGLAMFAGDGVFRSYRVPLQFDELVSAGPRFHIKPVLPLLQDDGRFYLLAASQKRLRLFEGTHYTIQEIEAAHLPANLHEALNIDEYVSALQGNAYTPVGIGYSQRDRGTPGGIGGTGTGFVAFHGHGGADLDVRKKDEIVEYFRRVNHGLEQLFHVQASPLVFAGVDFLFPLFKESCRYRMLIEPPVTGSPDVLNAQELHRKAWSVVEPHFRRRRQEAAERYGDLSGGARVSHDLPTVLLASMKGRVDTLLVVRDARVWGTLDGSTGAVSHRPEHEAGAVDLLEEAAVATLINNGTVYVMSREEMPAGDLVAAIFRYAERGEVKDEG